MNISDKIMSLNAYINNEIQKAQLKPIINNEMQQARLKHVGHLYFKGFLQ